MTTPPAPGVYPDASFADYLSWDCASRSSLTKMTNWREYTPQDVRYEMEHESPDSDALALGSALHGTMLTPETPGWELGPVNEKTKRTYGRDTKAWADYAATRPGVALLTSEQAEKLPRMVDALQAHPKAVAIFERTEATELTIVTNLDLRAWADRLGMEWLGGEDDHLLVKARLDLLAPSVGLVADLKTTRSRTEYELQKAFALYGYAHQAALYPEIARQAGYPTVEHFAAVFVRAEPPYRAGVFRAAEDSVRAAEVELLPAMVEMAHYYRTEEWPGWSTEIEDITLPAWKLREAGY
ncbi:MAG: PD-(D/E)XK nuclease-like domain-containing protein [Gemmatimonadota bacterium]